MTVLSGATLRAIRPVEPFIEPTRINGMTAGVSHAGYDIRVSQAVMLAPGAFALASTVERFDMPNDVLGIVHDKSTWARKGLSVFNTVIEPGWRGFLTLELVLHSNKGMLIEEGSPIAQVVFHRLDQPVDGYAGKYQDQPDRPVAAILERSP